MQAGHQATEIAVFEKRFNSHTIGVDFVPATTDWIARDFLPEDSFYLWGPAVPQWFVANTEAPPVEVGVGVAVDAVAAG